MPRSTDGPPASIRSQRSSSAAGHTVSVVRGELRRGSTSGARSSSAAPPRCGRRRRCRTAPPSRRRTPRPARRPRRCSRVGRAGVASGPTSRLRVDDRDRSPRRPRAPPPRGRTPRARRRRPGVIHQRRPGIPGSESEKSSIRPLSSTSSTRAVRRCRTGRLAGSTGRKVRTSGRLAPRSVVDGAASAIAAGTARAPDRPSASRSRRARRRPRRRGPRGPPPSRRASATAARRRTRRYRSWRSPVRPGRSARTLAAAALDHGPHHACAAGRPRWRSAASPGSSARPRGRAAAVAAPRSPSAPRPRPRPSPSARPSTVPWPIMLAAPGSRCPGVPTSPKKVGNPVSWSTPSPRAAAASASDVGPELVALGDEGGVAGVGQGVLEGDLAEPRRRVVGVVLERLAVHDRGRRAGHLGLRRDARPAAGPAR